MKKAPLAVLLLTLNPLPAFADGEYLLQRCRPAAEGLASSSAAQRTAGAYCFGLLQGIRELNAIYERKLGQQAFFCLGETTLSHSANARLVVDYLEARPEARLQNETLVAVRALRERYPCR
ncbi:Rap1a/Tai family immunity protein [Motiliproteus sediminis]|uniref:Rap1a/Tai family immunity protein n=1 Tax=Motiliproteus sediminis TaxID=1468178 RepID=UPI001AEFD232|nr:Rap1a/Tai family immunity protein [Motiliproteus sediminis]